MWTLTATHPHDAAQLLEEIQAAVPEVAPVLLPGGRYPEARATIDSNGDSIIVTVSVDEPRAELEARIASVIAAHNPTPALPPTETTLDHVLGAIAGAATMEDLKTVMLSWLDGAPPPPSA